MLQYGDDDVYKVYKIVFYLNEEIKCINLYPNSYFDDDEIGTCEKYPVGCNLF